MSERIVNIRGYDIAVEAKSGSQLRFVCNQLERRSDIQLEAYAKESGHGRHETTTGMDPNQEASDADATAVAVGQE